MMQTIQVTTQPNPKTVTVSWFFGIVWDIFSSVFGLSTNVQNIVFFIKKILYALMSTDYRMLSVWWTCHSSWYWLARNADRIAFSDTSHLTISVSVPSVLQPLSLFSKVVAALQDSALSAESRGQRLGYDLECDIKDNNVERSLCVCACVLELTPLAKPLVVFKAKLCSKCKVDPSGLPSTLQSEPQFTTHTFSIVTMYDVVFKCLCLYLLMIKAVRLHAWTLPALIPHGAWMPGEGVVVRLWMSALTLTALLSLSSPPMFTNITTSPKCSLPSFVSLRFTC